jgi:nucleotide-binding universal stress UspA family protein
MTSPKKIAVHVDGGPHDRPCLDFGALVANRFGAALDAVFARVPAYIPASIDGILTPQIIEAQQAIYRQRGKDARAAFDAMKGAVKAGAGFVEEDGRTIDVLVRQARYADLAIIGQASPEETDVATDYDLPADLVMMLGRPVLVLPYAGKFTTLGKRVLVAWSGSRESARALHDAMPYIAGAETVTVLMVNPEEDGERREADVKAYLVRHGAAAKTQIARTRDLEIGDVLLSTAADLSIDLIVMGAYGRSRFRELVLGGATHDILKHMTAPVLMSH